MFNFVYLFLISLFIQYPFELILSGFGIVGTIFAFGVNQAKILNKLKYHDLVLNRIAKQLKIEIFLDETKN